jgi:sodium-type flagellar protein MotY
VLINCLCNRLTGLILACLTSFVCFSAGSMAATFTAGIERSQWYLSSSIFECALIHDIPQYGRATFYHEAGETLVFFLDTSRNQMREGKAALVIEAPKWRPGSDVRDLGFVAVSAKNQPVRVENQRASQMLDGLLQGLQPTFTRRAKYNDDTVRIEVSSVNFSSFYDDYLNCVVSLLPVNFRQVERTRVFFKVDESKLTEDDKKVLDRVILYTKADPSVTAVYVDGHTDVTGRRIYNRRLSKERAESVSSYLVQHGIASEMITTRYHGERYPVAKAKAKNGHARNRRTTVRLVRGAQPQTDNEDFPTELTKRDL